MAAYQADIQLQVKGKAQLNQLEQQLQRVSSRTKELSRALNFNVRQQTVRLDTRAAMTAVRALEDRINRLGRTITVRLRTVEDARESRARGGGGDGGGGGAAAVVINNQAAVPARVRQQTTATREYSGMLRGIERIEQERAEVLGRMNELQQRRNALIDDQAQKIQRIARVETSRNPDATRNLTFGDGGASGRSPKQLQNDAELSIQASGRAINRLQGEIAQTQTAYESLSRTAYQFGAEERRRVMQNADAWDKYNAKVKASEATRARGQAFGRGALGAATMIPGLSPIAAGAGAGGAFGGGVAGAVAGAAGAAAITAAAGLALLARDAAKTAAEVDKMNTALESVTKADYAQSLQAIRSVVNDFNEPLDKATQQFTRLAAAGTANGLSVDQLRTVYRGLAAANKALGGDSERLQGILQATTQVFSKGKVQAEELRGQIGERLPGAFALFAQSVGKTPAQLDKALELGEVSIQDFVRFAGDLLTKYEADAKKIADSPAEAGARLERALNNMKLAAGPALASLGAMFQDFATKAVDGLTGLINKLNESYQTMLLMSNLGDKLSPGKRDQFWQEAGKEAEKIAKLRRNGMVDFPAIRDQLFRDKMRTYAYDSGIFKPPSVATPPKPPATPDATGPSEKELEKQRKEWERNQADLAKNQAEYDKALAQNAINLDAAVFQNRQNLIEQSYELERRLQEKSAENWSLQFTGAGRDQAALINQLNSNLQGYGDQIQQLKMQITAAEQKVKAAKAGVEAARIAPSFTVPRPGATSPSGRYNQGGYGPSGPNAYDPHFDIKRQDGGYFGRNALDQYVEVNGRALSSGLTVAGGQFGASRDGGSRVHNAWDFAFGGSASLGLKNGAKWLSNSSGSYGDNAVFQTPDGQIYRIIHGKFSPGAGGTAGAKASTPVTTAGTVDGANTVASAMGDVATAEAELTGLNAQLTMLQSKVGGLQQADFTGFILQSTDAFRSQAAEIKNSTAQLQLRNRLELEGVQPEVIEGKLAELRISQELQEKVAALDEGLKLYTDTQGKAGISAAQHAEAVAALDKNATAAVSAIEALTQAQLQAADPITQLYKQWNLEINDIRGQYASLASTIESEIGSAMSNAITGVITGTMTVQQAFSTMFANIGKAFIDMATQMIAKALVMKVMGILGGAFGGSWGGSPTGSAIPTDGAGWNQAFNTNLGFRASGGPVSPNSTYLVGENGPELLQMGSSGGHVYNNSQTTAALSRYSPAGRRGAAAVEGEGGTAGGGAGGGTFTLETVVINNVEYATVAQVREMGQAAAKQGADGGHSRVMGDFRNKRSTRARLGMR